MFGRHFFWLKKSRITVFLKDVLFWEETRISSSKTYFLTSRPTTQNVSNFFVWDFPYVYHIYIHILSWKNTHESGNPGEKQKSTTKIHQSSLAKVVIMGWEVGPIEAPKGLGRCFFGVGRMGPQLDVSGLVRGEK